MNKLQQLTLILVALIASGCTTNPYTGERQASKAAIYGAGAAAVCGIIGSRESSKRARNAALGCGVVGAGVGAYMDVQEAKLREQLQGSGVSIVREGDSIRLVMPGSITFETDKSDVRSSFYSVLDSVGVVLAKYNETSLRITGHTDSTGDAAYNQQLSQQRASNVSAYLINRGVISSRLSVVGMGESMHATGNATPEQRAQNRRVELYIIPAAS